MATGLVDLPAGKQSARVAAAATIESTTGSWVGFSALDYDAEAGWLQWADSRKGAAKLHQWNQMFLEGPSGFSPWSSYELLSPRSGIRTDRMQAQLLALAQRGDGDAAVTLTVQLRPGLLRLLAKTARFQPFGNGFGTPTGSSTSRIEAMNNIMSTFQIVLFNHDLARRPTKIAANLILDTRQNLWREAIRNRRRQDVVHSLVDACDRHSGAEHDPTGFIDELVTLDDAVRSLPGSGASQELSAELAFRSWVLEESNTTIARELSLSTEAVNTRLHRLRSVFKDRR